VTITEAFVLAQQQQQAGSLLQAVDLYRQILQADPANAAVLQNLAAAYEGLRDLPDAADCYRRLAGMEPGRAEMHYRLGMALFKQGKPAEAAAAFEKTLQLRPDQPEVHSNLGVALQAQGDLEAAIACYKRALSLGPDHAVVRNYLGLALKDHGKLQEALACYRRALQLKPDYPEAYINLGDALYDQGDVAGAEAAYRHALSLVPGSADAHNGLTYVLEDQGRAEEAVQHALEALRSRKDWAQPLFMLAGLAANGYYEFPQAQVERIQTLVGDPKLPPSDASRLHFALALLHEKRGAYDDAFASYRQANALQHRLVRQTARAFDPQKHDEAIDQLMATFTPEFFQRVQGFGLDTELPVFIVGMPRSGTTLVEQILSRHPRVFAAGELKDISRLVANLPTLLGAPEGYPRCISRLDQSSIRTMASEYLQAITTRAGEAGGIGVSPVSGGGAVRLTDKAPLSYLHLGLLAALFPRARVIHCRRDPRDVCLSCYFQYFRRTEFAWDLGDLGRYYRAYERLMDHWRAVLPVAPLDVVYEDLVACQETVSRQLVAFLGLPWDERCLAFYESRRPVQTASKLQVRRPIYTTSVGRWRHYEAHLKPLLDALGPR
jgi:tetratricopeptide (TPR) repeat protein